MKCRQIASIFVAVASALLCPWNSACSAESPALGTGTIVGDHVNVRGKATLASEVVTRVQKGEKVTILQELTPQKLKPEEPPRWFRIALPLNTPVWVHSGFLDETGKTALQRLNLRAGPGENYSILGRIEKGTAVKEFRRKEEWMEIEAPAGAYAFVAADLVEFVDGMIAKAGTVASPEPASTTPSPAPSLEPAKSAAKEPEKTTATPAVVAPPVEKPAEPKTEVVAVPENPPVVPSAVTTPVETPKPPPVVVDSSAVTASPPTPAAATPASAPRPDGLKPVPGGPVIDGKPTRRIVTREGLVSGTFFNSIQAPTFFALRTLQDGRLINYLHAGKLDIKLDSYKGRKVLVTGEEFMDRRWVSTPVLEVESIEAVP